MINIDLTKIIKNPETTPQDSFIDDLISGSIERCAAETFIRLRKKIQI